MKIAYYIRYFDAGAEVLGFDMVQCSSDAEAMRTATTKIMPLGCTSVEIARMDRFVWRGKTLELVTAVH